MKKNKKFSILKNLIKNMKKNKYYIRIFTMSKDDPSHPLSWGLPFLRQIRISPGI